MLRVLVVDDSALMRKYIREMLEEEGDIEVFTARDGQDALDQIPKVDPDVITLDINMPVMDGLTCLSHIMTEFPRPVIMVSSLTEKGALATFEALELGAVDYIPKPGGTISLSIKDIRPELIAKIRVVARSRTRWSKLRIHRAKPEKITIKKARPKITRDIPGLVLIGCSTGGPGALEEILTQLPPDFPLPVLVAQHMPARFTNVFAKRLNQSCQLEVREVNRPLPLQVGEILIAQGDADVEVRRKLGRKVAVNLPMDKQLLWHPSVDRMVRSALKCLEPKDIIAVQLTGMGYDGAEAMTELHRLGGRTIAESEETAVVFGMPRELIERGGADVVLPVHKIADRLIKWTM
jgi:two-component system chemotaxis response regulator CheB